MTYNPTNPARQGRTRSVAWGLYILSLSLLSYVATPGASAQDRASGAMLITARIIEAPSIQQDRSLRFTNVTEHTQTVSAKPEKEQTARFVLQGRRGTPMHIRLDAEASLAHADGSILTLQPKLYGTPTEETTVRPLDNGGVVTLDEAGQYYLHIGGDLAVTEATAGRYQGTMTMQVIYE